MWEKQRSIPEMVSVDQAGMTYPFYSEKHTCGVVVEFASNYSQLRLSTVSGDCVYQSEWLDVSPLLDPRDTVPAILEGLKLCQQRAIWLYTRPQNGLKPVELTTAAYEAVSPYLA